MRVDLVAPFEEKDAVKALGARWDSVKRIWYVVNVPDLTPFMRWIPNLEAATNVSHGGPTRAATLTQKPSTPKAKGPTTKPLVEVPHCGCNVLPWEDCVHTTGRG